MITTTNNQQEKGREKAGRREQKNDNINNGRKKGYMDGKANQEGTQKLFLLLYVTKPEKIVHI